jgi:acyl carrier protein
MNDAEIMAAIFSALRKVAPESNPELLSPDVNIRTTLDIDSYDFLNFLIDLHEQLDVEIPESDYGKLASLEDMRRYLASRK